MLDVVFGREAEVAYLEVIRIVRVEFVLEHDVVRLEVAVQVSDLLQVLKTSQDASERDKFLPHDDDDLLLSEDLSRVPEEVAEVPALQVLEYQVQRVYRLVHFHESDDVRMFESR